MKRHLFAITVLVAILAGTLFPFTISINKGTVAVVQTTAYAIPPSSGSSSSATSTSSDQALRNNISCGFFGDSSIGGCISDIFFFIPYSVGEWLLTLSAYVLDTSAALTLSSTL